MGPYLINPYLVPQATSLKWMFGETTISYVKIGNHPIETTTNRWLFGVPGTYNCLENGPIFVNPRGRKLERRVA